MNENCAECGYPAGVRYHPLDFCRAVKAGLDPEAFIKKHARFVGKRVADLHNTPGSPEGSEGR